VRVRRRYSIRGKDWKVQRIRLPVRVSSEIDWPSKTISLNLDEPEDSEALIHELLHAVLERAKDQREPHYTWEFSHNGLAKLVHRMYRLLTTGTDQFPKPRS
jgi:hypothetical protein